MALAGTGAELNHLTPRPTKTLFADNYIAATGFEFQNQFLLKHEHLENIYEFSKALKSDY